MKITHICLCGMFSDGFSYQENLITKYQVKAGFDVSLIATKYFWNMDGNQSKSTRDYYVNEDGVTIHRLDLQSGKNIDSKFKRAKNIYEILCLESPDILFVHGVSFLDIDTIVKYARKHKNIKIYVDNHADFTNSATNWISKNILHKIIWKYYAHMIEPYTTKFYGVLPVRVDFLKNMYGLPAEKCELLVMGADDDLVEKSAIPEVRARIREKYGLAEDDFVVMTGGKIDGFKTQTLLLMEAVKNIEDPKVKLIVFGSVTPDLKERVNALTDGTKVQYIGWVQAKDSYEYFAAADLVVFPGRHSVFWEQVAAQGVPMLCKKWDGTTHVDLGGNVRFLTQDSVEEIQSNIETLVRDRTQYDNMKKIAMEKGMKEFSYRDIAKRSIEVTK